MQFRLPILFLDIGNDCHGYSRKPIPATIYTIYCITHALAKTSMYWWENNKKDTLKNKAVSYS